MMMLVLDKYAYYHNVWRRAHPNFFFSRVLWNVFVLAGAFFFFSFLFTLINLFHNILLELMYALCVSVQTAYLLYRRCVFSSEVLSSLQQYEDVFIISGVVSCYLLLQTVLAFVIISALKWAELVYPFLFLFVYFAFCAGYLYVEVCFFYALWTDARWKALIEQRGRNEKYELFCAEVRRRRDGEYEAYFDGAYRKNPHASVEEMADAFAV